MTDIRGLPFVRQGGDRGVNTNPLSVRLLHFLLFDWLEGGADARETHLAILNVPAQLAS